MPSELFNVVKSLERSHIPFILERGRPDTVTVSAWFPGELWEIDVFEDNHCEISRFFRNNATEGGVNALVEHLRWEEEDEAKWQEIMKRDMQGKPRQEVPPDYRERVARSLQMDGAPPLFEVMKILERSRGHFVLTRHRPDAISVLATFVGERWEIQVYEDDRVACVRYRGDESIEGEIEMLMERLGA